MSNIIYDEHGWPVGHAVESSHVYSNREIVERVKPSYINDQIRFTDEVKAYSDQDVKEIIDLNNAALSGKKSPAEQAKAKELHRRINVRSLIRLNMNLSIGVHCSWMKVHEPLPKNSFRRNVFSID